MRDAIKRNAVFLGLLIFYAVYAALYIYRTSFFVDGVRYFSLVDDPMISMRYARNLAEGHGLVWNPGGPRVEGYTNPLFVFYMAIIHLLPIGASKISVVIQATCAFFLLLNLVMVKKAADMLPGGSQAVSLGVVAMTAFYTSLNDWGFFGSEVAPMTFLLGLCAWLTLKNLREDRPSPGVFAIAGLGTWLRPDFIVPYLTILIFLLVADSKNRKTNLVAGILSLAFFLGSQSIFRLWYFGELLPNTYYLKLTGYPLHLRISRGLYVFLGLVGRGHILLFLVPAILLLFKRDRVTLFFMALPAAQIAYSIYVGGDAWEDSGMANRFIALGIPMLLIPFAYALYHLTRGIIEELVIRGTTIGEASREKAVAALYSVILVAMVFTINTAVLKQTFLMFGVDMQESINRYLAERAAIVCDTTTAYATVALPDAGITPYFCERQYVDMTGKNDKRIATMDAVEIPDTIERYIRFLPGHMKYDSGYSLAEQKPDVILRLYGQEDWVRDFLDKNYLELNLLKDDLYFTFYYKKGSPNILWERLEKYK